jgi:hypothetical protein
LRGALEGAVEGIGVPVEALAKTGEGEKGVWVEWELNRGNKKTAPDQWIRGGSIIILKPTAYAPRRRRFNSRPSPPRASRLIDVGSGIVVTLNALMWVVLF